MIIVCMECPIIYINTFLCIRKLSSIMMSLKSYYGSVYYLEKKLKQGIIILLLYDKTHNFILAKA